ncbi:hypothetical protein [Noviherbaspirillum humi]|nr:hypothetical protein [Noviherbaspirillum humi]
MLIGIVMRAPKAALAGFLLALIFLAMMLTHAGVVVVGMIAEGLGISRFFAGLLLGFLFMRLPRLREGRLGTVGILPIAVRRPTMLALLALGFTVHLVRGDAIGACTTGFALAFMIAYQRVKRLLLQRWAASFSMQPSAPHGRPQSDPGVIDVEFRERRD